MMRLSGGLSIGRRAFAAGCAIVVLPTIAIAQNDCGAFWEDVGGGVTADGASTAIGLTVAEVDLDGAGPSAYELFLGGRFKAAGGVDAASLAKWDGFQWNGIASPAGLVINAGSREVWQFVVHDPDGPAGPMAPRSIASGQFEGIDDIQSKLIAQWDGQQWSAMSGLTQIIVWALASHDFDGSGPQPPLLVAGGNIWGPGGTHWGIWTWDGSAWSPLGLETTHRNGNLLVSFDHDEDLATPSHLIALRSDGYHIWNGSGWTDLGWAESSSGPRRAAITDQFPGRVGERILVVPIGASLGVWDGSNLEVVAGFGSDLYAVEAFDPDGDGLGPTVIAAGGGYGGVHAWTGTEWLHLEGLNGLVYCLRGYDEDKGGPRPPGLFATGQLSISGHAPNMDGIAKWSCPHIIQRCMADLDVSGAVDFTDIVMILGDWGRSGIVQSDANRDGVVGFNDVTMVLGLWGSECAARPVSPIERAEPAESTAFERHLAALAEFDGSEESRDRLDASLQALRAD